MPNHVHLVIIPIVERIADSLNSGSKENLYIVTKVLQDLKKYTARECNKLLNRKGSFWQHESYDHVVRDMKALRRIVDYVLNNPGRVGTRLCKRKIFAVSLNCEATCLPIDRITESLINNICYLLVNSGHNIICDNA